MESTASSSSEPPSDAVNGSSDEISCEQGKLFVGGIPWDATEEHLRDYFGKYGQVVEVIIMKDRVTGNPRGFGFVSFVDPSSADVAIHDSSSKHSILGRPVSAIKTMAKLFPYFFLIILFLRSTWRERNREEVKLRRRTENNIPRRSTVRIPATSARRRSSSGVSPRA